jgi:hypothetical protein
MNRVISGLEQGRVPEKDILAESELYMQRAALAEEDTERMRLSVNARANVERPVEARCATHIHCAPESAPRRLRRSWPRIVPYL